MPRRAGLSSLVAVWSGRLLDELIFKDCLSTLCLEIKPWHHLQLRSRVMGEGVWILQRHILLDAQAAWGREINPRLQQ